MIYIRVNNIKITLEIPIKYDSPDKNNIVYQKGCFDKTEFEKYIPIIVPICDGTKSIVGVVSDIHLENQDDENAFIKVEGVIWNGGTHEYVTSNDGIVESVSHISAVGIDVNSEMG